MRLLMIRQSSEAISNSAYLTDALLEISAICMCYMYNQIIISPSLFLFARRFIPKKRVSHRRMAIKLMCVRKRYRRERKYTDVS